MEIKEKIIGVIGGMGPEATLDLFYKIIKNTPAKKDQDHIHLIIDNYPQIPDRTSYILGKGENPLPYILKSARMLEGLGVNAICMPCNTSHFFEEEIRKSVKVPFISIIRSVIDELKENYSNLKKVGLIATKGTLIGKVYENPLKNEGFIFLNVQDELEERIMEIIYSVKSGIVKENKEKLSFVLDEFIKMGAEVIIAGCTEIPLILPYIDKKIPIPIIDSTLSLAKSVIKFVREN